MKKSHIIGGIIAVIAIVCIIVFSVGMKPRTGSDQAATTSPVVTEKDGINTYTESDYGFTVQYPTGWILEDQLTPQTCCVFVAHISTATTTALNASGTPEQKVVQTELVKVQIGAYDKRVQNPFSTTTRQVTLNGKQAYTGYTSSGEYFLIPRDANTGIGAAEFRYTDTPQADVATAQKIIGSITFVGKPAATASTATTTKK